jgi:hypothetical protein
LLLVFFAGSSPRTTTGVGREMSGSPRVDHKRSSITNPRASPFSEQITDQLGSLIHEVNTAQSSAACKLELDETIGKKRREFGITTRKRMSIEKGMADRNYPNVSWKPKGILVAHLHEHKVITLKKFLSLSCVLPISNICPFLGWNFKIGANSGETFIR